MNYYLRYDYDNFQSFYENIVSIRHGACFEFMGCKVKFYQIPDKVLMHLGLNENSDRYNNQEETEEWN